MSLLGLKYAIFIRGGASMFTCFATQWRNNEFEIGATLLRYRMCERERRRYRARVGSPGIFLRKIGAIW